MVFLRSVRHRAEGARDRNSTDAARPRRRGDRMKQREVRLLAGAAMSLLTTVMHLPRGQSGTDLI